MPCRGARAAGRSRRRCVGDADEPRAVGSDGEDVTVRCVPRAAGERDVPAVGRPAQAAPAAGRQLRQVRPVRADDPRRAAPVGAEGEHRAVRRPHRACSADGDTPHVGAVGVHDEQVTDCCRWRSRRTRGACRRATTSAAPGSHGRPDREPSWSGRAVGGDPVEPVAPIGRGAPREHDLASVGRPGEVAREEAPVHRPPGRRRAPRPSAPTTRIRRKAGWPGTGPPSNAILVPSGDQAALKPLPCFVSSTVRPPSRRSTYSALPRCTSSRVPSGDQPNATPANPGVADAAGCPQVDPCVLHSVRQSPSARSCRPGGRKRPPTRTPRPAPRAWRVTTDQEATARQRPRERRAPRSRRCVAAAGAPADAPPRSAPRPAPRSSACSVCTGAAGAGADRPRRTRGCLDAHACLLSTSRRYCE